MRSLIIAMIAIASFGTLSAQKQFDFKGLHLGMTHAQVDDLVRNTPWGYSYGPDPNAPANATAAKLILSPDRQLPQDQRDSFAIVGRDIYADGATNTFRFLQAIIYFSDGKVSRIDIGSPLKEFDDYPDIVEWSYMALGALTEKLGAPTRTRMQVLAQAPGSYYKETYYVFADWTRPSQSVMAATYNEGGKYFIAMIIVFDPAAEKKRAGDEVIAMPTFKAGF